MKTFNKLTLAVLCSLALSSTAFADAESTWDQVKHETKSTGHDVAEQFNNGQAALNEKLGNVDAANQDRREAQEHRLASGQEELKADAAKAKGEMIDKKQGTSTERAKADASQKWNETKRDTKEGWDNTKHETKKTWNEGKQSGSETWDETKAKTKEGWKDTKSATNEAWNDTKRETSKGWDKTKAKSQEAWDDTKSEYNEETNK